MIPPAAADSMSAGSVPAAAGGPLVSTSISHRGSFKLSASSLRVDRPDTGPRPEPPDRSETSINSFSAKSRRRLRLRALDAFPALVSQFGLTYHDQWPVDGRQSKVHLDTWLKVLRRLLPDCGYLWLLEFQQRNAPHYHVFLTVPPDRTTWELLAAAWVRITDGTDDQLWWHGPDRGENWIDWDMRSGTYLCKYLDKEAQKFIPLGYVNFGRFWGNSRGLAPVLRSLEEAEVDEAFSVIDQKTGEVYGGSATVIRWLGRLAEKQTCGLSRFRTRAPHFSYTIIQGSAAFRQIEQYFHKLKSSGG